MEGRRGFLKEKKGVPTRLLTAFFSFFLFASKKRRELRQGERMIL